MFSCTEGVYEDAETEALSGEVNLHSCSGKAKICVTVVKEYSQSAFSICLFLYASKVRDATDSVKSLICLKHDILRHLLYKKEKSSGSYFRRTFLFSSSRLFFYPYLSIFFTALLPLPVHFLLLHPLCSAQTLLLFLFRFLFPPLLHLRSFRHLLRLRCFLCCLPP